MERFDADHATMQQNAAAPRVGKPALIRHEQPALAAIARMTATCIRPVFIAGDCVVLRWVFAIEDKQGQTMRFEELAWQGELMAEARFLYDPAQLQQR